MFLRLITPLACTFALATFASADIIATPADPPLDTALCGGALPAPTAAIWNGQMKGWSAGAAGRPMVKVTLDTAGGAVCNDGSPAVIYVRPAPATIPGLPNNPYADSYHIHFKGGGSCRDFDTCKERFCATGPKVTDKPGLMSTLGYADEIEGEGLFLDRSANQFSYANQVLAPYCSSDTWIGSTPAGTAVSIDPADDPADVSTIAFMGEAIVAEFLDTLDAGVTVAASTQVDDYVMPSLLDAPTLLISGDSGGASGARSHLDRIAARYPATVTVGAMDAGGAIDMQDPRIDYSTLTATPDYDSMMKLRVSQARVFFGVDDTALDESCAATISGAGPSEYPCFDSYQLQRDFITTPTIQRSSYTDSTSVSGVGAMLTPPGADSVRTLAYDGMLAASAARPNLSVLGANCSRHVTYRNNKQVKKMRTLELGQTLYTDLETWVFSCFANKSCPKVVHLAAPVVGTSSHCP